MKYVKDGLRLLSLIVGAILLIQAAYLGCFKHDYAQACFDLLLVLMMKD